jgi:myo-inositol 2-dehydrogenase/D-chiro-inositol 1-dehydrogenase
MTVKFGLLGAGRIGRSMRGPSRGRQRGARRGGRRRSPRPPRRSPANTAATIRSIEEIEAASDIDAVGHLHPTDTHADLIERLRRAGKAGVLRKPVDLSVAAVRDCLRVVEETARPDGRPSTAASTPDFMAAKAAIDAGAIGEVEMVTISSSRPRRAARGLHQALRRHLPRHDHPRLRHGPLASGEEPETVIASASV